MNFNNFYQDDFKSKFSKSKIEKPGNKIHGNALKNFNITSAFFLWFNNECRKEILKYMNDPSLDVTINFNSENDHIKEWYDYKKEKLQKEEQEIETKFDECDTEENEEEDSIVDDNSDHVFNERELIIFVSCLFGMMLNPAHNLKDYHSKKPFYNNSFIKLLYPNRENFLNVWRSFRCNPFWLMENFNNVNKKKWNPEEWLTVDETLIRFDGRYKYKQHIKGKPSDTGIKLYMITDSKWFTYKAWLYTGYQPPVNIIIKDFYSSLPDGTYGICCDSYFGGHKTACTAFSDNVRFLFASTVNRIGKDINKIMNVGELKKSSYKCLTNGMWIKMCYKDKKSICFDTNDVSINKKQMEGNGKNEIVERYQKLHVNVDVFDKELNLYNFKHRIHKWSTCSTHAILRMMLINSYTLYKDAKKVSISLKSYIEQLAIELAQIGGVNVSIDNAVPSRSHTIEKLKKKGSSRCYKCINSRANFFCTKCKNNMCSLHCKLNCE
jgi:hypothetical protein